MERVFVDMGSSVDIMFIDSFKKMNSTMDIKPVGTSLFGFAESQFGYMVKSSFLWFRRRGMETEQKYHFHVS